MFQQYNYSDLRTQLGRLVQKGGDATWLSTQGAQAIQMAHCDIRRVGDWPVLYRNTSPWIISLVPAYNTGSVTVTENSATITGSGTTFTSAMIGRKFRVVGDNRFYIISAFTSATQLTLKDAYENGDLDGAGKSYLIYQDTYNLPTDFGLSHFVRHENLGTPLTRKNLALFYTDNPTADQIGDPFQYDITENGVENQPVSASTLSLTSSAAGDGTKKVLIRGLVNYESFEEITFGADATVAVATTKSFSRVDGIFKQSTFTGLLTVTANSDNVTVHTIPPEYLSHTRKKIQFYYLPKNKISVYIAGWRDLMPLIRDYDVPELSTDLYLKGALAYALQMGGEWEKAAMQFKIFGAAIETERGLMSRDYDEVAEIRPDSNYSFGSVF